MIDTGYIWQLRYEIAFLLARLKKSGMIGFAKSPFQYTG
mgnify:CR=1 FL=1